MAEKVDKAKWHRWYAWRPIIMKDHIVFCEEVARRKKVHWQYKDMIDFLAMESDELNENLNEQSDAPF